MAAEEAVPQGHGKVIPFRRSTVDDVIAVFRGDQFPQVREQWSEQDRRRAKAALVFAYWAKRMGKVRVLLDWKRERRLMDRLRENGDDVSELLYVVDAAHADDFLMGRSARARDPDNSIRKLFFDRETVEELAARQPAYRRNEPHPMATKYEL